MVGRSPPRSGPKARLAVVSEGGGLVGRSCAEPDGPDTGEGPAAGAGELGTKHRGRPMEWTGAALDGPRKKWAGLADAHLCERERFFLTRV